MRFIIYSFSLLLILFLVAFQSLAQLPGSYQNVKVDTSLTQVTGQPGQPTSSVIDWNALNRVGMGAFSRSQVGEITAAVIPVDENYQLGPGDRLGIYLLGNTQREYDIIINAEGKAYLPGIGVFDFNNQNLASAKEVLKKQVYRYFSETEIELLLIQPKSVMVSVVGEVKKPGRYTLSGLQTTFDAIFAAGGPLDNGSLRNVQVIHANGEILNVDLYDLLLKGEGQGGYSLQPGDIVKCPPVISSVRIAGEIKRPGQYELDPNQLESLDRMIDLAAGPTPLAYLERVEISRRLDDGQRKIWYVDAQDSLVVAGTKLEDGDRIRIYSVLIQQYDKTVEILGEVKQPGKYAFEENLTIRDLIQKAGGITASAYLLQAELDQIEPKKPVNRIKFPLEQIWNGTDSVQDYTLDEYDRVIIRRIPEWHVGPSVEVRGEMNFPGRYTITKDSTKLSEVLKLAGGFTRDALLREAELIRPSTKVKYDPEYERLKTMRRDEMTDLEYEYLVMKQNQGVGKVVVDFHRLWDLHDASQDVILEDGDIISIPKAPQVVEVTGRVSKPGGVLYKKGADINYYIQQAGGVTWDGRRGKTKVVKATGEILDDEDADTFLPGDIIWVPRKPDRDYWGFFRDAMMVIGQLATIYLVIDNARR